MKKQCDLTHRLMNYSLLALGVIAVNNSLLGQTVYTDIDPDIILTEDEEWKYIDLDNDGLDDVGLMYSLWTTSSWSIVPGYFKLDLTGANQIAIAYGEPCTLYSSLYGMTCYIEMHEVADVFAVGNWIGPANDWGQIERVKYRFHCGIYGDGCSQGYFNNASGLPDEQFFAFRLTEPDLNYCWLRLYWADDVLLLTGYACDTTGNTLHISVPEETFVEVQHTPAIQINCIGDALYFHSDVIINDGFIRIYNVSGREIYSTSFSGNELTIPFDQAKGMYIVQLRSPIYEYSQQIILK